MWFSCLLFRNKFHHLSNYNIQFKATKVIHKHSSWNIKSYLQLKIFTNIITWNIESYLQLKIFTNIVTWNIESVPVVPGVDTGPLAVYLRVGTDQDSLQLFKQKWIKYFTKKNFNKVLIHYFRIKYCWITLFQNMQ